MALRIELRRQGNFLFRHRSYLPLSILLAALLVYVVKENRPAGVPDGSRQLYELACFGVCVVGLLIRVVAVGYSADHTSGRNTGAGQVADTINRTGLYSQCRHPLYVGNFLMWLGLAGFTANGWFLVAFVLAYWLYYERIIYAEEEYLIEKFGDVYLRWSAHTPAVIPRLSHWVQPPYRFSWRKVIRQEKAGILAMFVVVVVFRGAALLLAGRLRQLEPYWVGGLALALLWYGAVKLVQKRTTLLADDRDR